MSRSSKSAARVRTRAKWARAAKKRGQVEARDPLVRQARNTGVVIAGWLAFFAAAAVAHAGFTEAVGVISTYVRVPPKEIPSEPIEIELIEPDPKEVVEIPLPTFEIPDLPTEPEPEPVKEDPPPEPPEAPPENVKPPPPPETPNEPPPPPPTIGVSFESTVPGGDGPKVATGNTLGGTTDTKVKKVVTDSRAPRKTAPPPKKAAPGPNKRAAVIPVGEVKLVKPKRKSRVKPPYPPELKAQGIEATVVVEVTIGANGKVKSVKVIAPAKEAAFNTAAKKTAFLESFEPATKNGKAISFSISYAYRFRIND